MNAKLTFISAGAGSGKTHTLMHILHKELAAKRVKPSGVIATTFTRKAATELRERVRGFLLEQGEHVLANAMGQARIGTVNAVCGELLRRFAFEAGLPTEQTVLEEEQATALLRQAIDLVQATGDAAALRQLRERLSIEDWDEDFKNLVSTIRANDIAPDALAKIAQENADDLLSHFPAASSINLTEALISELDKAIPLIQASAGTVKKTATYLDLAVSLRRGLRYGDARWSDWVKISKEEPASAIKSLVTSIQAVTEQTPSHPDLHQDIRSYLKHQFALAASVLDVYSRLKVERGLIDFTDQERLLLKLLDNPFVAETLQDELDLLMVDEFQDTSPIQLALFLRLTKFAKQVYWVGDVKQAIYGFRGSDTELMEAILKDLESLGGTKKRLDSSWRSRKPLVNLVNSVFVPAFANSIKAEDVALIPQRKEEMDGAAFGNWMLPGNANEQILALGHALRQLVDSGYSILDKGTKMLRPATLADIAILRRSNANVTTTAQGLRAADVPAMTAQPGLLKTPEAVLALACLRRLNDAGDTLASAEIISLSDCSEPEVWVSDRLAYLAAGNESHRWREQGEGSHQILSHISRLRSEMPVMAPAEALATTIASCQLPSVVMRWNRNADNARVRLANLDALLEMAKQYETICSGAKHAASVSGLLLWLNEQAAGEADSLALPAIDAVQVMTHHKAKGLEWPIVVLMDTHGEVKDGLWNSLRSGSRCPISASDPLNERTLRLWPWPFGKQQKLPFKDELARTPIAQKYAAAAVEEAKRVLYVSMTRARDLLIFAMPSKTPSGPWLETLGAPWLQPGADSNHIALPTGESLPVIPMPDSPAQAPIEVQEQLWWYPEPTSTEIRLPRVFNPSSAESPTMTITETISFGERIDISSKVDWTTVGYAVHATIALAFADTSRSITVEDVENILKGYQLTAFVSASALQSQVLALAEWVNQKWPGAKALPEWPIEAILPSGQIVNGRIDLLLDVGTHWILIDHKSNPGARSSWPELANTHGGQLLTYKQSIELSTNKPVKEIWIFLPVTGGAIQIERAEK
ncbi:MAG: UvrD-helicase domain-containing protein [Fluviibacter phosphoraccumulans]